MIAMMSHATLGGINLQSTDTHQQVTISLIKNNYSAYTLVHSFSVTVRVNWYVFLLFCRLFSILSSSKCLSLDGESVPLLSQVPSSTRTFFGLHLYCLHLFSAEMIFCDFCRQPEVNFFCFQVVEHYLKSRCIKTTGNISCIFRSFILLFVSDTRLQVLRNTRMLNPFCWLGCRNT